MGHLQQLSCEFPGFNAHASTLSALGRQEGAASSGEGANAGPGMSGATRQRFQNTAVNKVKVSRFAGRRLVFMSWTVSKQTSNLYVCLFVCLLFGF